jgi:signal transduction histidine kinase
MQQSIPQIDDPSLVEPNVAMFAIHDLKGAVHAIQGFLSVLRSEHVGPLTDMQQDFVHSAFITARRIERLVGDLQVFELGDRSLSLIPTGCDLSSVLQMCVRELEPTAIGFGVCVAIEADPAQDWHLVADPIRLEQVAFNMIENAIRYADANTTVVVRLRQSRSRLVMVVENTATSVADIDLDRLSKPFQRGTPSALSGRRGLGIGLSVVKTLVAAHGGIVCTRVRGTTVSIAASLPRQSAVAQPIASN